MPRESHAKDKLYTLKRTCTCRLGCGLTYLIFTAFSNIASSAQNPQAETACRLTTSLEYLRFPHKTSSDQTMVVTTVILLL